MTTNQETYYDILGVDSSADAKTIRQAYLKQAVKYHPDKNPPDQVEKAKARFVEIGHAYEVLSDPEKRLRYDREIRSSRYNGYNPFTSNYRTNDQSNYSYTPSSNRNDDDDERAYQNYRQAFDEHVSSMSEAELAAMIGLASVVGGLVGSFIGSKLGSSTTGQHAGRGGGSALLSTIGAVTGSMLASQAAAETVRTIHQQSVERVEYQRQQNVEFGDRTPNVNGRESGNVGQDTTNHSATQINLENVISAVSTGLRLWQNLSTHR